MTDPRLGEIEQLVQTSTIERNLLGSCLHFDEAAIARHHDVEVDIGVGVFAVVEVEQRDAIDDTDRDGSDRTCERLRETKPLERATRRNVRPGDRGATRATVGLQDIAVEGDGE